MADNVLPPKLEIIFVFDRGTQTRDLFIEDETAGNVQAVDNLYIRQSARKLLGDPRKLKVTIEAA